MALVVGLVASPLCAQQPRVHYRHHSDLPPGAIGSAQLQRGGPLPGYFQPVEIVAPPGARISLAAANRFLPPQAAPVTAGLLVGGVYRFRVSEIPHEFGGEVFPTVEVIDRLYPPGGQEVRFPIVVEITQEDLELALDGKFVTRVIYLEHPDRALPAAEQAIGGQNGFDAAPGENPLEVADRMGRPMAILRMGGWLPINNQSAGPVDESLEPGLGPSLPLICYPKPLPPGAPRTLGGIPSETDPATCPPGFDAEVDRRRSRTIVNPYAQDETARRSGGRVVRAAALESAP